MVSVGALAVQMRGNEKLRVGWALSAHVFNLQCCRVATISVSTLSDCLLNGK